MAMRSFAKFHIILVLFSLLGAGCFPQKKLNKRKYTPEDVEHPRSEEIFTPQSASFAVTFCNPGDIVREDCKSEISNSGLAYKNKTCNDEGSAYSVGNCVVEVCNDGTVPSNNSCTKSSSQLCIPGSSRAIDCKDTDHFTSLQLNVIVAATEVETCDSDGLSHTYTTCKIQQCEFGYEVSEDGLNCDQLFCPPGDQEQVACDPDELVNGNATDGARIAYCSPDGTSQTYSPCIFSSCKTNHFLLGNTCVQPDCTSDDVFSSVSCSNELDGLISGGIATKSESCDFVPGLFADYDNDGTDEQIGFQKIYGNCEVQDENQCILDTYFFESGIKQCLPMECHSNYRVSCVDEKPYAIMAYRDIICDTNSHTYDFENLGACTLFDEIGQASPCQTGYEKIGDECVPLPRCPQGFVEISGNSSLGTKNFCVSQYEAGIDSTNLSGSPIANVTAYEAFGACSNNFREGYYGKFNLITNAEWMTIAREIENNPLNWSGGVVGEGYINRGWAANSNFDGFFIPSAWTSISLPSEHGESCEYHFDNGCAQIVDPTDPPQNDPRYFIYKRSHVLSSGELIWDIGGSVFEFVDWSGEDLYFTSGPQTCLWPSTATTDPEKEYTRDFSDSDICLLSSEVRPLGNYNTDQEVGRWRGYRLAGVSGVVVRGGGLEISIEGDDSSATDANHFLSGIYGFDITDLEANDLSGRKFNVGFRCTYHFPE